MNTKNEKQMLAKDFRMRRILGSARELTTEVLRLLVLYPYKEFDPEHLGNSREYTAAKLCETLPKSGGVLMVADDGRRLLGLMHLEPMLGPSAAMNMHIWNASPLIVAPEVTASGVAKMMKESIAATDTPVDFVTVKVPSADAAAAAGLQKAGFRVMSGEAVAVAMDPRPTPTSQNGVRFLPFDAKHIDAAMAIACDCLQCNSFACNQGFDRDLVCKLTGLRLRRFVHEKDKNGLLVLDSTEKIVGFATYCLYEDTESHTNGGIGSVDQMCVSADGNERRIERILGRRVMNEMCARGVTAVTTRTTLNRMIEKVGSLKKIGFEVTHSNLVMSRWLAA